MAKNRTSEVPAALSPEPSSPALSLEKAEKGSHRSMWELLLQLRVLLPYLSHLVPLLDRSVLKASPDFAELAKGIAGVQTSTRDVETLARNQALQLERMEEQLARMRVLYEVNIEEGRRFSADMRSFRRWMIAMTVVVVVLLGASVGILVFLVMHP
jgi:hypothetical protein